MRKTSPEAWAFALFLIAVIVLPIVVGILFFKFYRQVRPFPEIEQSAGTFAALDNIQHDGFLKSSLVGWLICGPIFYWVYVSYLA